MEIHSEVRPESRIPASGEIFGGGQGLPTHLNIASIVIHAADDSQVSLPPALLDDLNNPHVLSSPTIVRLAARGVDLIFDGGDGEKGYQATFRWDIRTRVLTRKVLRRNIGAWTSQWRLIRGRWKCLAPLAFEEE